MTAAGSKRAIAKTHMVLAPLTHVSISSSQRIKQQFTIPTWKISATFPEGAKTL